MDEVPEKMMLDHEVKQANPWDVASIFEFNYFCCPECDCKLQLKQDFINHASFHHPWALDTLQQISDGSLEDINFPGISSEIKQEAEDYELPSSCLEVNMNVGVKKTEKAFVFSAKCSKCNKRFKDKDKLIRHEKSHRNKKSSNIEDDKEDNKVPIDNDTTNLGDFDNDVKTEEASESNDGDNLDTAFELKVKTKSTSMKKIKSKIKGQYPKTELRSKCGKKFRSGPKFCNLCNKDVYGLAAHRKDEHKDVGDKVSCPECTKTFPTNMALSTHIANVHEKNPCSICGEMIPKYEANRHFRKAHTGTAKCSKCGKICTSNELLRRHIADAHDKSPCTICGEMIAKRRAAQHYAVKHTANEDKRHKCKFCGKGFVEVRKLKDHINTHTGEKPYLCKLCGAAFADKGNHRKHERGHLNSNRTPAANSRVLE